MHTEPRTDTPASSAARRPIARAALLVVACATAVLACSDGDLSELLKLAPPPVPTDRPIEVVGDGFVTSDTCRACHASHYASWDASYHSSMTQEVTPATMVADIADSRDGDVEPIRLEHHGERFLLERRGDEYWVELDDPEHDPEISAGPPERVWRQLVISTGSHHFQAYWFASGEGRKLSLFLFCYRIDSDAWIPVDSAFLARPDVHRKTGLGRWNLGCQQCHVTQGRSRVNAAGEMDTHVAEFGIACESCHGGGEEHVKANRDPLRRYTQHLGGEPDPTIVDPADLKPRLTSQVCGQCHGITELKDEADNALLNARGTEFTPGKNLTAKRKIVREGDQYFWPDGMVRVSGREYNGLIESPCYQHSDQEQVMSCLSCHRMHHDTTDPEETRGIMDWADDQLKPRMRTDHACTQCHSSYLDEATRVAHTHHAAGSAGSECMNCHMPFTTWGLLKSMRSHTVDSPSVRDHVDTGRPNACNLCHLDRTLGWTAEHLGEWFGQPEPELTDDQRSVASSVLDLLTGDAGQRGLVAAAMGWAPAQTASGTDWLAPYLSQLLEDPYDAVRFRATRSLEGLEGFEDLGFDFTSAPEERRSAHMQALGRWAASRISGPPQPAILMDADGGLESSTFERLLSSRDDRPMVLAE